jgi:hypothetical protein
VAEPRVTVIIATYNRSERIRPTIESVLSQTRAEWELLVVSDGSTDDTDTVVESFGDDRIKLVRTAHTGHPGAARNAGLERAHAPVVAYLDHDDRFSPDHLDTVLDQLEEGADVVATGCRRVDSAGRPAGASTELDMVWAPELQVLAPLFEPTRVAHRTALGLDVGGWPTDQQGLEDWGMWMRLTDTGARFATTTARTCALELSSGSRRHRLGSRFALVLARYSDVSTAQRALDRLGDLEVTYALDRTQRLERAAWYADLAAAGDVVLPAGVSAERLQSLVEAAPPENYAAFTAVVPDTGGGAALAQPLLCCDPAHAARVRETLERRFPATLTEMRRVLAPSSLAA